MANAGELIDIVVDIVQDDSFGEDMILALMNMGLTYVAAQVLLPELDTTATISTDIAGQAIDLPANFMRNLYRVAPSMADPDRASKPRVEFINNPSQFWRTVDLYDLDAKGDAVTKATILGLKLVYWPTPETQQALDVSYYRKPTPMVLDNDEPTCIPEAYHAVLADYACYRLWRRIEDGVEGQKVNTKFYMDELAVRLAEINMFIRQGQSRPPAPVVAGCFL